MTYQLVKKYSCWIFFLGVVISCSAPKKVEAPKVMVKQISSNIIRLKPFKEIVLENGLKIIFVRDMALPRIELSLLVKVGQRDEGFENKGVNYFTSSLLEEGTTKYNADQLADQLAILGSAFSISPGTDFTFASIDGLTLSSEKIIELFSEILFKPAFKEGELVKIKKQTLSSIKKINDNNSQLADLKINQIIFNNTRFSDPIYGTESSISKIKRSDIIKHYLKYYRPNNSLLAVTGAITDELENRVIEVFKTWPMRKIENQSVGISFSPLEKKYFVTYKKAAVQSEIRMSLPLFPRNHPDHLKMRLANEVIGGGFVSRLNSKIRDQMGLTYSISSEVDHRKELGVFEISTFTKNESTAMVIDQIEKELQQVVQQGITAKELSASKNLLMGQFPRTLETADAFAFNLMNLQFYEIPNNYLSDYYRNLEKITLEEINLILKEYIDLTKAKFFILAAPSVQTQLKKLEAVELK